MNTRTGWRGVAQGVPVPVPAAAVLSLMAVATPEGPVVTPNARWCFAMVVFAPVAETFLLAFPMLAAMRCIRQGWLAAIHAVWNLRLFTGFWTLGPVATGA